MLKRAWHLELWLEICHENEYTRSQAIWLAGMVYGGRAKQQTHNKFGNPQDVTIWTEESKLHNMLKWEKNKWNKKILYGRRAQLVLDSYHNLEKVRWWEIIFFSTSSFPCSASSCGSYHDHKRNSEFFFLFLLPSFPLVNYTWWFI